MENIIVDKDKLIGILEANRKTHTENYVEALRGYRITCAELLAKELEKAEGGQDFNVMNVIKHEPKSYEKEYTRIIEMLKMDINKTVELTHSEFAHYVQDNWTWKESFMTGVTGYSGVSGYSGYKGNNSIADIKFSDRERK